jgi:sulfur carrier protein
VIDPGTTTGIVVNGEGRDVPVGGGLGDLLREMRIDPASARGIAIAVNEEVVPKQTWEEVRLRRGDRVEIITARQGG